MLSQQGVIIATPLYSRTGCKNQQFFLNGICFNWEDQLASSVGIGKSIEAQTNTGQCRRREVTRIYSLETKL